MQLSDYVVSLDPDDAAFRGTGAAGDVMSASLFDSLSRGLSVLLAPIVRVVEEPGLLPRLLAELGVPPDANSNALLQSLSAVAELKDRIEALGAQETPSFESIAAVLDAAADAFEALRKLEQQGPLAALEGLGRELVDLLLMAFLESRVPAARPAAALLTLLEPADERAGQRARRARTAAWCATPTVSTAGTSTACRRC